MVIGGLNNILLTQLLKTFRKLFSHSLRLFTAIVTGDTPEEIYSAVKEVIKNQSGPTIWIAAKDKEL